MPGTSKTRKFIDKRNSQSFFVVYRSQRDPLINYDEAPQGVLKPLNVNLSSCKEEERKFGVFYDDTYDYMQHLRTVSTSVDYKNDERKLQDQVSNVMLPSSVFASAVEDDVGMLNKAAPRYGPRPDWDPDIVATLDDEFDAFEDPENDEMEDDFVSQLMNGEEFDNNDDDMNERSDFGNSSSFSDDELGDLHFRTSKSTTGYSMSSSVIHRNDQLRLLDDRFEHFFNNDYGDDDRLGALDCDHIEGGNNSLDSSTQLMQRLLKDQKQFYSILSVDEDDADVCVTKLGKKSSNKKVVSFDSWDKSIDDDVATRKWDCESIISTKSNLYNHPMMIREKSRSEAIKPIAICGKTGIPKGVLGKGLTASVLNQLDRQFKQNNLESDMSTLASRVSAISFRNPHETNQEKRDRKASIKLLKRERRMEKKMNKKAFRTELDKQNNMAIKFRQSCQGAFKIA